MFRSRLHGVCMGGVGQALVQFMHFSAKFFYVGGFCHLRDYVLPTLRGASDDVMS